MILKRLAAVFTVGNFLTTCNTKPDRFPLSLTHHRGPQPKLNSMLTQVVLHKSRQGLPKVPTECATEVLGRLHGLVPQTAHKVLTWVSAALPQRQTKIRSCTSCPAMLGSIVKHARNSSWSPSFLKWSCERHCPIKSIEYNEQHNEHLPRSANADTARNNFSRRLWTCFRIIFMNTQATWVYKLTRNSDLEMLG